MNVTLKKAAALATALASVSIAVPTTVTFSIYEDQDEASLQKKLAEAISERDTALTSAIAITDAVYKIRALIGRMNDSQGIGPLLTERANIDKLLQIVNAVPLVDTQPNLTSVQRQLTALTTKTDAYSRVEAVSVKLPSADAVSPIVKRLKKRRVQIEDELAQLNFGTTITLPDDVVELLREHDLV